MPNSHILCFVICLIGKACASIELRLAYSYSCNLSFLTYVRNMLGVGVPNCLWLARPGPASVRLGLDINNPGVFNIWAGFRLSDRAQILARPRIRSACNLVATLFKQLLESPNNLQKA